MHGLCWLASFPKSGSTWLRTALHGLIHGPLHRSSDLGLTMPSLHGSDLQHARRAMASGGVVLTHKAAGPHLARYPLGDLTIQLVRHPADVFVSEARFFALTQLDGSLAAAGRASAAPADLSQLAASFSRVILMRGATPERTRQGILGWGENVESWMRQTAERPGLLVRYEDLKDDLPGELRRIAEALGLSITPAAVERAVEVSSLASMRAMQEREIQQRTPGRYYTAAHEKAYAAGLRFVAKGTAGQGLQLSAEVRGLLHQRWGAVADALGYDLRSDATPVRPLDPALRVIRPVTGR